MSTNELQRAKAFAESYRMELWALQETANNQSMVVHDLVERMKSAMRWGDPDGPDKAALLGIKSSLEMLHRDLNSTWMSIIETLDDGDETDEEAA